MVQGRDCPVHSRRQEVRRDMENRMTEQEGGIGGRGAEKRQRVATVDPRDERVRRVRVACTNTVWCERWRGREPGGLEKPSYAE